MTTWTLRSLFGMDEERNTAKANRQRYQRDKRWRKRKAARDQYNPESLEQRAMMAVVAPAYEVTQDWGSGFQAEIELQNLDVEAVNDWTISFNYGADITSIWDATVVAREGDRYTIANAGWNADLEAGRSVAFGFIGSPDVSGASVEAPVGYQVNGEPIDDNVGTTPLAPVGPSPADPVSTDPVATDPVATDPVATDPVSETGNFNAVFNVISDWGSGFTGEVAVQNLSSETLNGWEASFDFGGDINSIWNGAVVNQSGSRYTVRGALWNPDISAGGTVTFGFNGTPGGAQAALENFVVMGIHDGPQPIAPSPVVPMPLPMPEPTPVVDPVDGQGNVFTISPSSSDIVGFNPSTDRLDFGDVSVHNLIVGKTESGEVAIVNPWAWSPEFQVLSGVAFNDLTAENFGVVVNEHLRQDIGGVLSWELGVGPRDANTVYVRSHEYGVQERIENFDPATTKLSFLYFGTRERLSVDDTDEGLLISVEPTGQSVLLVGVAKNDLLPGNLEFHHDQIVEDQLEVPFGYTVDQVTMVSRSALLTPEAPAGELTDGYQTSPGSIAPHDGHDHGDHGGMPMPMDPVVTDPVVTDPVVTDPVVPVMPPMDGHDGHDDMPMDDHDGHDHMAPPASSGEFIDITAYGTFYDSNDNSHSHELVGGRTAITTEAMDAYNNLRAFLGLSASTIDDVGEWAFAEQLTNNADPYGNDIQSVGLYYAMQGAKVGWIAQDKYDPQILADIQRTARLGDPVDVMSMVREVGISGYADYLEQYGVADTFISTLKMEPHYGGVMHGRTHGYLSIEGVAINHDLNHLTVLSWDQSQPFMNDTFDWPQWPALDVSDSGVMEYYQSMVVLGDPVGLNMESVSAPVAPPVVPMDPVVTDPVVTDPVVTDPVVTDPVVTDPVVTDPVVTDPVVPVMPPMDGHDGHDDMPMDDHDGHDHMAPPASSGEFIDITAYGTFYDSNDNSHSHELVGGRTAITTEAMDAYNNLRAFLGLSASTIDDVGEWAFAEQLTNNADPYGNDIQSVGLYYAMQGAKVGWIAQDKYDPQILADIQRTARLGDPVDVMSMVREVGISGYADYLEQYGVADTFISTLKMEPHYGGVMHGRTHGYLSIEGVAINHDLNHLTVLSWDQSQPFMNDTFDWPQWPALDVSDSGVMEYYQSMVVLGDPVGLNMESVSAPVAPPVVPMDPVVTDPVVTDPVVTDPVVTDPVVPVMPPMDGHDGHDDMPMDDHDGHDHMAPPASSGEFIDITAYGTFYDSNDNSHSHELVGGRTAITTEAMDAYNNLRAFLGLSASTIDDVGEWAFAEQLTNNADPYGNDIQSVGLYYAMQGAKVGWIAQDKYDPQILADIQRTARLGDPVDVMSMVREVGISGYADYLEQYGVADTFISTLKMEPHYGGVMHGRTHGYLSIEGVAINHDLNHLTVLSWDQSQPFMNDTFDWPQWPALDVSDSGVMEYYQSMVVLGDPVGLNMESVSAPVAPPVVPMDPVVTDPVVTDPVVTDPVVTDPVVTDPVVTDPVVTDPVVTDPVVTDPVVTDPVVTDPVVTDPSASPIANYDKVLAAYFPEWGIYGRDYQLADVPADELTHLIYAFADLNAAGEMTLFDSYAATEKRFSAEESVTGEADQWYYPPEDPRSEQTIWGNFNQLALLKEANPHLTLSIAVGGWTLSDHFSTVTSTQAGRDTFSDSIVEFLTTYQVFDGIDFDWEYPGGGGESGNSASPNDGANYALLMTDVRAKLDDLGSELGRTYEISIASPAGLDKIANFNLAGLAPSVDFFNVMTYDFHGTWEDTTGHQAAFTGDPVGYDIETAVDAYLDAGVASEQIVLGAPLYTRAWSGVADGGDGGYNEASSGAAPGTYEAGNYDYKDLLSQINDGAGWDLYWDDNAQASYVYNAGQDIFSSFETTTSIALKAEWADAMGLGGMMFWDLSNDATDSPDSLISAAFRSMVLEEDLADIQSDSSLPDPIIVGGDGVIGPLPL